MLLVFFLVTSSMDSDKGIGRVLSPKDEPRQEMQDIHRSDVLQIRIDDQNALFCDEQPVTLAELQQQVESFLASRQTENYVLDVVTARQSSYDAYFNMQNAIVAAYRQLRNDYAKERFGIPLEQCTPEQRDSVTAHYPQRISEGEPDGEK